MLNLIFIINTFAFYNQNHHLMIYNVIIGVITAYLIGSIATSVWIGRAFFGVDIRTLGSGNAGATNTIRVLGSKPGMIVLVLDVFKGWFAVFIGKFFVPAVYTSVQAVNFDIALALAAVIGHIFPIYIGFKGGKGVATLVGVIIALYFSSFFVMLAIFLIVLQCIKLSYYL